MGSDSVPLLRKGRLHLRCGGRAPGFVLPLQQKSWLPTASAEDVTQRGISGEDKFVHTLIIKSCAEEQPAKLL